MARRVFERALSAERCAAVCDVLERCAVEQPKERDPERQRGINGITALDPPPTMRLADAVVLQSVRELLDRRSRAFFRSRFPELTCEATLFKQAFRGHRYPPHLDGPYRGRVTTALLYFNDCDSGAVSFGEEVDGVAVEKARLVPRAGRLVLFDDSPANLHWVEPSNQRRRFNVMSWYRAEPPGGEMDIGARDWVLDLLLARRTARYAFEATSIEVTTDRHGTTQLVGVRRAPGERARRVFRCAVGRSHVAALRRLEAASTFSTHELLEPCKSDNQRLRCLELLVLLAKAGAIGDRPS